METEEEAVVVPLVHTDGEPSTEAMLRMILNREAIILNRGTTASTSVASGMVAQGSGAFAKAIGQSMGQLGRTASTEGLYRVILPTGAVARDLVPAVGGGFRGIVRASGTGTKFAGHARLVPAALGGGAALAAGPLIATVALAVAGEMLAQYQTNKKLAGISNAVFDLQARADDQERSILSTASKQTRRVAGYLLDQAQIPSISSAAHAFGDLDTLTHDYTSRLDRWVGVVAKYADADRVYAPELLTSLVGKRDNPTAEFERLVAQTYEALALRARVTVLEKVAAEFSNPNRSLPHVESVLRSELSTISDRQAHLVGLIDDLSVMQIDSSKVPVAFAGKGTLTARTSFSRLARALHSTPDGLPVLNDADQTVLELEPGSGSLSVLAPTAD